ncbi:MAG: NAD-dependent protein deacylase [Clostridia bacterium]|nr:NAD-dependent protein deacylase [Clostridia bacterium]
MEKYLLEQIEKIREILYKSSHAVFFGGAGVSTDSGIPDFRSSSGLYSEQSNEYYLSRSCLYDEPQKFFEFYRKNMIFPDAKPNKTHLALAELEKKGIIKAVITQNIDGLHQAAGSGTVIELHGTVSRSYCMNCKKTFSGEYINGGTGIPVCDSCGGIVRPDVTLYEENLDGFSLYEAAEHIDSADVLIVGGTSLRVFPAAGFVQDFKGENLIIINRDPTPFDSKAQFVLRESLSEVFSMLL